MELVNVTPVPARLFVARLLGGAHRAGMIVAKATFRVTPQGPALDTQDPVPILAEDHETELGLLPRDDLPRRDEAFEVALLGAAYAPRGRPVQQMTVGLSVGGERRELAISGDRRWEGREGERRIGPAAPFTRMPLTYERAFGGRADVEIDREAFVEVSDLRNPRGRGFDPGPPARGLAEMLRAPEGYPRYDEERLLPNVEDPAAPIRAWDDAPDPASWAPLPMESALHAARSVRPPDPQDPVEPGKMPPMEIHEAVFHRAHPTWIVSRPEPGSVVTMSGLTPDREVVSFRLPALQVVVDYVAGTRAGTRELTPQLLLLLPEEERFYLVFRHAFMFEYPSAERSMRLRLVDGGAFAPERS
ncbi:DUF2169 domain-containing protein [Sorangium sp. So ce131]|uniref:DUF2169 domain-containing protein n=1 Tax=Sorangium sp. So ce131 TaxID=3133282 RepID=UPI003F64876F